VTPPDAWRRLRDMQDVLADQPLIAHAVRCLPLCDMLELQLELLSQPDWPDFEYAEPLSPNVIRFRPRRRQLASSLAQLVQVTVRATPIRSPANPPGDLRSYQNTCATVVVCPASRACASRRRS
jgi:hypothetical protein